MTLKANAVLVSVKLLLLSFNGGHCHTIVQGIYTRAVTMEHKNNSTILKKVAEQ